MHNEWYPWGLQISLHIRSPGFSENGEGGGYFGVNFGHLKSEVFQNGGGGDFWSEIPERGFLENLDKNLLFSQKPACASQIVSHIRMWRLMIMALDSWSILITEISCYIIS